MKSYRYLFKNIGLLTFSQFGSKFLSFFLVPLYTNVLTTTQYGLYDLFSTTISLMIPIFTLNIADSSLRFALEQKLDKREIFSVSLMYFLKSSLWVICLLGFNHFLNIFAGIKEYEICFVLLYLTISMNGILTGFARGSEKIFDISLSSIVSTVAILGFNLLFLIVIPYGLAGYFVATILGITVQNIYLIFSMKLWEYIIYPKDSDLKTEMLSYSRPLILNSISWWVNNASDRYVVTLLCGLSVNGIYSVAYKIPSILNIFQVIFNQAWTLSAVKDFDSEDSTGFFSQMYTLYNLSMIIICSILIIFTKLIARLLYANSFYDAWQYVPFLLLSIVFGSISGYTGGIFSATKKSKIFAHSTVIGAAVNIFLNIVAVYFIGAIGAAISTAIAYWIVWEIRMKHLKTLIKLDVNIFRDRIVYLLLLVQCLVLFLNFEWWMIYGIEFSILAAILLLYKKEMLSMGKTFMNKLGK